MPQRAEKESILEHGSVVFQAYEMPGGENVPFEKTDVQPEKDRKHQKNGVYDYKGH
jgi:hypothetical protein